MTERIKVFCSHNSVDKPKVKAVAERLAGAGIDPWVDQWEIKPGDDIVASINDGLAACQVGLIFFSHRTQEKSWVNSEISSLIYQSIEDGKQIIPVMLDADAPVPELLRPRARVAAEDIDWLIDAIYGRSGKPTVDTPRNRARERRFHVRLQVTGENQLKVSAEHDAQPLTEETSQLGSSLQRSYRDFLDASLPGASRMSNDELARQRELDLTRLGQSLSQALLPGAVGAALANAIDQAASAGESLRLEFEAPSALLALPFEATLLPDGRVAALEPGVRVLRRQAGLRGTQIEPQAGPLRILVAVGVPDEDQTKNQVLNYEHELQTILDAIDHARQIGNAEVKILEVGHPDQIKQALLERSYHVLHISGHGAAGVIELEDEDGRAVEVTPHQLAESIRASGRSLPLIFLAACLSGAGDSDTTGFAQGLLQEGVPLVLAMQTSVSDWYATRLAGTFYDHLSRMETPLASHALSLARLEVEQERRRALARGEQQIGLAAEYATPSLFTAADEQPLLDRALPQQAPIPQPPLPPVGQIPMLRMDDLIGRRPALRQVTGILRDDPRVTATSGRRVGVLLHGIGGVGKSALAGRVMARLADAGWTLLAQVGRWSLGELALTLGGQLIGQDEQALQRIGERLLQEKLPDSVRLQLLQVLLANHRVLLVLDNFEDNLTLGGGGFLDEGMEWVLSQLLQNSQRGKLLLTCRYPVPGTEGWLAAEPLGPLSLAETRKLFYRLPSLSEEGPESLSLILRHIGGHPRMLEYLDAILRQGEARLQTVTQRLRENAVNLGLNPEKLGGDLEAPLQDTLQLGAADILLDQLIELVAERPQDLTTLQQCAAFALPVDSHGLAFALAGAQEPPPQEIAAVQASARRLISSSLLSPMPEEQLWVHRWTAQALRHRQVEADTRECSRRAGEYRAWRMEHHSHSLSDGVEATRRFLEAAAFDRATAMAGPILDFMETYGQLVDVASFTAEVLEAIPADHEDYYLLCIYEADALTALGVTERAMLRYRDARYTLVHMARIVRDRNPYLFSLATVHERIGNLYMNQGDGFGTYKSFLKSLHFRERLARAEPGRADYQRNLSVSYDKMGDLYQALGQGDDARQAFQLSLDIRERLARAEPGRTDYQRDLSVSYNKMGDLYQALGQGDDARQAFQLSLDIAERLARAEPGRADYQRDLSVSYNKMGDLFQALGQGDDARQAFQLSLDIAERLARAEPGRADYQRDLSVSYNKMGDLFQALGQGDDAQQAFQLSLDIRERLASTEPGRADYQWDLVLSLLRIADYAEDDGASHLARALAILRELDAANRLYPQQQELLSQLESELTNEREE